MENHHAAQTMILSMNLSCCDECPKKLKKKLLKMTGVESVAIDTENNLVFVTGTVNAVTLLNDVAALGKTVKLLPNDRHPKNHVKEKHNITRNEGSDISFAAQQNGKTHKNCCCRDGRHNHHKKDVKKEEEEHKCEAYVPPTVDERVCRDFYCKIHPKSHKIVDQVPAESSNSFGTGGLPFHGGFGPYGPYGGGSYVYPGWYRQELPQFGYGRKPRMLPQHPFGFR